MIENFLMLIALCAGPSIYVSVLCIYIWTKINQKILNQSCHKLSLSSRLFCFDIKTIQNYCTGYLLYFMLVYVIVIMFYISDMHTFNFALCLVTSSLPGLGLIGVVGYYLYLGFEFYWDRLVYKGIQLYKKSHRYKRSLIYNEMIDETKLD